MSDNITLNANECECYITTNSSCCDFFTMSTKTLPPTFELFKDIVKIIVSAKNEDPETFLQLIKFHRLIDNGNGIKWIYYLAMMILKIENVSIYKHILNWSWEYPKDLHNLFRMNNTINKSRYTVLEPETKIYSRLLYSMFINLLENKTLENYNPMLVKYLSFESNLWCYETKLIWNQVSILLNKKSDIIKLISKKDSLSSEIAKEFRSILYKRYKSSTYNVTHNLFTNKVRRQIKVLFNHHVNLTDNLFKGIHSDGSLFGSHNDIDDEILLIHDVLKKTPTISNHLCIKKIKKIRSIPNNLDTKNILRNGLLVKGYEKYVTSLKLLRPNLIYFSHYYYYY